MSYKIQITRSMRKSIALKVDKVWNIIIKAPFFVTKGAINSFIDNHTDWIEKRRDELKNRIPLNFECGDEIMFLWEKCRIKKISKNKLEEKNSLNICKGLKTLVVVWVSKKNSYYLNENIFFEDNIFYINEDFNKDKVQKIIKEFYKKEAKEYIVQRTKYFIGKYSLKVNSIKIGSAKTRWWTCSSKKDIRFTYLLMSAPLLSIDYVIVHELAHLKEMNHSKAFWSEVERMISDYKVHKVWFKDNKWMSLF